MVTNKVQSINVWNYLVQNKHLINPHDKRPRASVSIQGAHCNALFDTGSEVTIINADLINSMTPKPVIVKSQTNLKAANGTKLTVLGAMNATIIMGKRKTVQSVLIVQNLGIACIIGHDLMAAEGVLIDTGRKRISFGGKGSNHTQQLRSNARYTIEPHSERIVFSKSVGGNHNQIGLVQAVSAISTDFTVNPALVRMNYRIPVLISNASDMALVIERNQEIATIQLQDEDDVSNNVSFQEVLSIQQIGKGNYQVRIGPDDVNLTGIPQEYRLAYLRLLNQYVDVFSLNPNDVGHCRVMPQRILLKNPNQVSCTPPYRVPHHLKEVVIQYVDKLLAAGIIRRSESPFSSPLMLVRKPHGEASGKPLVEQYRVVHDFRRLNANTVRDSYPLRNLYELIDAVAQAKVWSIIDLSSGFWNQELTEESKEFTAFGVPSVGHFEYNRSAQGLCNSSATFQRLLDYVLQGLAGTYVYIDDVIAAHNNHEEHLKGLEDIFRRFRKYQLKCRLSKLQLGAAEVNYLGYNISQKNGIRAGEAKTRAVREWTEPKTVKEIKQFIGLCSFFRRTIHNFASISSDLTSLTRKNSGWTGGRLPPEASHSFNSLKKRLCERPCLTPVNFSKEFILTVDTAAESGMGAILSQIGDDGVERPCAYASRAFAEKEKGGAAFFSEHQGMLWACRHFKPYLVGQHFTIRTDHKPLTTLNSVRNNVLNRIHAEMEEFQPFTVEYLAGDKMPADGLSRLRPSEVSAVNISNSQLLHLQKLDQQCKSLLCRLKFGQYPMDPGLRRLVLKTEKFASLQGGLVCVRTSDGIRAMAPKALQHTLLQLCHDHPTAGHFSTKKTISRIAEQWWWPHFRTDVQTYCKQCHQCASVNHQHDKNPVPLRSLKLPKRFNDRVHIDLLGPLPKSNAAKSHSYLLVMTDAYSKYLELAPLINKTTDEVSQAFLNSWISKHGCCKTLVSDQGSEFDSFLMRKLCARLAIQHDFSSVAHPRSNGIVENKNRTIISYCRKYLEGTNEWEALLPGMQLAYNTSVHTSTGFTPYFLAFNRRPNMPHHLYNDVMQPNYAPDDLSTQLHKLHATQIQMRDILQQAFLNQKAQFDKRAKARKFTVGDRVYVDRPHTGTQFQKFQPLFRGPYVVTEILSNDNYRLREETTSKEISLHVEHLKLVPFKHQHWNTPTSTEEKQPAVRSKKRLAAAPPEDITQWEDDEEENINLPPAPLPTPPPPPAPVLPLLPPPPAQPQNPVPIPEPAPLPQPAPLPLGARPKNLPAAKTSTARQPSIATPLTTRSRAAAAANDDPLVAIRTKNISLGGTLVNLGDRLIGRRPSTEPIIAPKIHLFRRSELQPPPDRKK